MGKVIAIAVIGIKCMAYTIDQCRFCDIIYIKSVK